MKKLYRLVLGSGAPDYEDLAHAIGVRVLACEGNDANGTSHYLIRAESAEEILADISEYRAQALAESGDAALAEALESPAILEATEGDRWPEQGVVRLASGRWVLAEE